MSPRDDERERDDDDAAGGAAEPRPALIRLDPQGGDFDAALRLVAEAGGRVLHAFPPHALIAELPGGAGASLVGRAGIRSVSADEIPTAGAGTHDVVADVWNAHLRARRTPERRASDRIGHGLSWGAPGLLPPDPPPEVQAELRRREREAGGGASHGEEGTDREP